MHLGRAEWVGCVPDPNSWSSEPIRMEQPDPRRRSRRRKRRPEGGPPRARAESSPTDSDVAIPIEDCRFDQFDLAVTNGSKYG